MKSPPLDPLPIDAVLPAIVAALREGPAVVVQAPPGAGKTTRVPLAVLEALDPKGMIVMLEPRRVAARAAAATLARNLGEKPGGRVGHQVRFETVVSKETRIMVVTEGILSRRFIADPTLDGISVVLLDELHERSIHTDLALAFLKELLDVRDDLKVVCMSATLDAAAVSTFLGGAPVVTSAGRPFPVTITHLDKDDRYLDERVAGAIRNVIVSPQDDGGDVLCFLPGAPEIKRVQERLAAKPLPGDIDVVPLYGALSPGEQDRAIARGQRRRVVLATNVAETSLTLEGVSTVVDSGLVKIARHDPASDRTHLDTARISLSSAEQRAGRAGRTRPGRCVRLWTTTEHHTLEPNHAPEIARADLAPVLLDVLSFHPGDPRAFPFFERPPARALDRAIDVLTLLGAIEAGSGSATRLSSLGRAIAALPVHPRTAAMLLAGGAGGDVEELCLAAALFEDDRAWSREQARTRTDSDLMTAMDHFDERRHRDTARARDDLRRLVTRAAREHLDDAPFKEALLRAFPDRLCRRRRAGAPEALMVGGRGVTLAKESGVLDAELFLALALEGDGASARVRIAEEVSLADVERALPRLIERRDEAVFDEARGALAGVRRTRVASSFHGGLIVEEKAGIAVSPDAAAHALADVIAHDPARHLALDDKARAARDRLAFARMHLTDVAWPEGDDVLAVLTDVCQGKRTIADVQRADWASAILARLSWEQKRLLDDEVPARLEVPTGNMISVDYAPALAGAAPVLAVRLQELFGLLETPRVARGRVAVVLHLLSPGYKPVQVTTDLASFWKSTYGEVKRELRARYPKHSWPDDPLTAAPVAKGRSTKRQR